MATRKRKQSIDHPPVEINLYRRTALGFGVMVTLLLVFVSFLVLEKVTITVHAEDIILPLEMRMKIQASATMDNEIAGGVAETIVRAIGEGAPTAEGVLVPAQARGVVILFNNQPRPQTLIPTTRLLSKEGVLFRLKNRATIPARGELEAEVYADEVGARGNIGPTHFIIPGLREELQKLVYADSVRGMSGGEISKGSITSETIEKSYAVLKEQLEQKARGELGIELGLESANRYLFIQSEILEQNTDGKVGETGTFTVSMSLHVVGAAVSEADFLNKVRNGMSGLLPSHRELREIALSDIAANFDAYDVQAHEVDLKLLVQARTRQTVNAPELAKKHFFLLSKEAAGSYLDRLEGVGEYRIKMPFYMMKIPKDESRLKILVQ